MSNCTGHQRFIFLSFLSVSNSADVKIGTMSLNEIAVDLTCEPEPFQPARTPPPSEDDDSPLPGQFAFPAVREKEDMDNLNDDPKYHVHGGMLKMAKAMGDIGKPVHLGVLEALHNNPDFGTLRFPLSYLRSC